MTNVTGWSRALTVAAMMLAGTAAAAKPITLAYKIPEKAPVVRPALAAPFAAGPVRFELLDARGGDDPAVVGAQRERGKDVYLWRAEQPVAAAVAGFTRTVLEGFSVRVGDEAESGLTLKLTRYRVAETSETFGSSYRAEVRMEATLLDRAGGLVWTREISGEASRSGPDARAAICNELLSLALRDALAELVSAAPVPAAPPPEAVEPAALFADLSRLKAAGTADDVLVSYVKQRRVTRPLTVDEILAWKNAGLPDAAIKATME